MRAHGPMRFVVRAVRGLVGMALTASRLAAQSSPDDAACQPPPPPSATLTSTLRLVSRAEPGEPMELVMRFRGPTGEPLRSLLVYVYHANAGGAYRAAPGARGCLRFHGALHGWARPDSMGQIMVHSIRPGAYPRSTEPAHVHVVVQFPRARGFYLNDLMFADDPRLTPAVRAAQQAPGGSGVVHPVRGTDGTWRIRRDIVLQPPTR